MVVDVISTSGHLEKASTPTRNKWPSEVEVHSLPWAAWVVRCHWRCFLDGLAMLTSIDHTLDVFDEIWPPHVAPCNALHSYDSGMVFVKLAWLSVVRGQPLEFPIADTPPPPSIRGVCRIRLVEHHLANFHGCIGTLYSIDDVAARSCRTFSGKACNWDTLKTRRSASAPSGTELFRGRRDSPSVFLCSLVGRNSIS